MKTLCWPIGLVLLVWASTTPAALFYVDVNSANPTPPYASWSTAATNIQNAVDLANAGDTVNVLDGVYNFGGTLTADGASNRVAVTKAVVVQSVNGAVQTWIDGGRALRCVYLTNGAVLNGFTLTNGAAGNGGGVACASTNALIENCQICNNTAASGGGSYLGTLTNCTLSGNTCPVTGGSGGGADGSVLDNCNLNANVTGRPYPNSTGSTTGGGAYNCVLNNCTVSGNTAYGAGASGGGTTACTMNGCNVAGNNADYGPGGAYNCLMTNCTVASNGSSDSGGGVTGGTLYNCVVTGNNSGYGGGAYYGATLYNCTVSGNYAGYGGGANSCTLVNCLVTGNTAGGYGGGAYYGTLVNCTVTGNTAQPTFGGYGGGAYNATLENCIVYYNTGGSSGPDDYGCSLNWCCTPTATGAGNITNAPLLDANDHLEAGSPCIDAGTNADVATALDLAGNLRIANGRVDLGAYEYQTPNPLTVSIQASLTNAPILYPVSFTGDLSKGQSDSWNFGDGTVLSNRLSLAHTWTNAGDYPVTLTVYDVSAPAGVSATLILHVRTQVVYYVNAASTTPAAPYSSWSTAATDIQMAIDAALPVPQSLVLVTNGIYQRGGTIAYGALSNRVMIDKPITVQSVNGPAVTVIQGRPTVGDSAVRCVYLTNNANLTGFTLRGGATRSAGDSVQEQSGGGVWCESAAALVSNCVIASNNAASEGGGAYGGVLENCVLTNNSAAFTLGSGNGGGASASTLANCLLLFNVAGAAGGGANNCVLNGSALVENSSGVSGGGADSSTLNNCTLIQNASLAGGGANGSTLNNSIIYYNSAANGANYSGSTLNDCCTVPMPNSGPGNITSEPRLTDSSHLAANSPCIGAGSTNYATGTDIDGQAWLNPPSIGCDEFYPGAIPGPLVAAVQMAYTNVASGFAISGEGIILGHASNNVWNFGDGSRATNRLTVAHAWATNGSYAVVLTAFNADHPGGVSATNIIQVLHQPIHYVSAGSVDPVAPYSSWATAAANIQDAVDAAFAGSTVLVSNGVYQSGGRVVYGALTNRVAIYKPITVLSVNGPAQTVIQGYQVAGGTNGDGAVRCVCLSSNTMLSGFTLSLGATRAAGDTVREQSGGGALCADSTAVVSNCVFTANTATYGGGAVYQGTIYNCAFFGNWAENTESEFLTAGGGAALLATLNNCLVSNNWVAANNGGGASYCVLSNCSVLANSAYYGGGVDNCTLFGSLLMNNQGMTGGGSFGSTMTDCILQSNSAAQWGGGDDAGTLINCLVISNWAGSDGGGTGGSFLNNCTVVGNSSGGVGGGISETYYAFNCISYYNTAASGGANVNGGFVYNCCTTPDPNGIDNITNAPLFVDSAAGDYRLQSNSPCINSGDNAYVNNAVDLDGNPRIVAGTVDIGAYEYQRPLSRISYAWLAQYHLPMATNIDTADLDGTGFTVWQDWTAGLNPTNARSVLAMLPPVYTNNPPGLVVAWQSVSNRTYFLQGSTNLQMQPPFTTIQSNIPGQPGTTSITDTTATTNGTYYYRVGVQ